MSDIDSSASNWRKEFNFELNSPDIEALNGMTDSSSSSSSSNYDDNDSSFYKNYTDGDSASYDYGEFGSNDTVTYDLDPDTSDVSNKFFLDNTELEKIFPSPSSASGIEHFNSHIIQLLNELKDKTFSHGSADIGTFCFVFYVRYTSEAPNPNSQSLVSQFWSNFQRIFGWLIWLFHVSIVLQLF